MEQGPARLQMTKDEIVLLALAPGVRDINKPDSAVIFADTRFVELRVTLEKQEATKPGSYRAVMMTVDGGRQLWGLDGIKLQETISAQYVVVRVQADRFRRVDGRDFMVTLSAAECGRRL
jgi:hypothetical protein